MEEPAGFVVGQYRTRAIRGPHKDGSGRWYWRTEVYQGQKGGAVTAWVGWAHRGEAFEIVSGLPRPKLRRRGNGKGGIFWRDQEQRYMVRWSDNGQRKCEYAKTLEDAEAILARATERRFADVDVVSSGAVGRVYLFESRGMYKIGFTTRDPEKRARAIETMACVCISVVSHMPGTLESERALHARFSARRLTGEWFSACPEIRAAFP